MLPSLLNHAQQIASSVTAHSFVIAMYSVRPANPLFKAGLDQVNICV